MDNPLAELWITQQDARHGCKKRFHFKDRIVELSVPNGVSDGTFLRLPGLKKQVIPLMKSKDAFVKIHVLQDMIRRPDYDPFGDDDLNQVVECLIPYMMVLDQIDSNRLYEEYERTLSLAGYSQSIFRRLKHCTKGAESVSMCKVKFIDFAGDSPGRIVHRTTTTKQGSFVVKSVEDSWIEIKPLYRYHTRVLGAILAHELMHHIAHESGLESIKMPEIRMGRSFKKHPTSEALVDIAAILAGAGELYLNAISVDPQGMTRVFGYMDQRTIAKTVSLAESLLHGSGLRRIEERRLERAERLFQKEFGSDASKVRVCRRCGEVLIETDLGRWTCRKCGGIIETL